MKPAPRPPAPFTPDPSASPLELAAAWGQYAASVGFDWPDPESVRMKVFEELDELDEAIRQGLAPQIEEELGDVLFSLVMWSRHLGVSPHAALGRTLHKFARRFEHVEATLRSHPSGAPRHALEAAWDDAKRGEP